jgi:protein arginine N-methyltransferase 2
MDLDIDEIATDLGERLINDILEGASIDAISAALEAGAPIWYQNQLEGISPLHAAAYMQNLDLVKLLIEKAAVWNAGA